MAALKEPVKMFIVQSLACFETPQQVVEAVKQDYKIEITRQQVALYDPTKVAGRKLSSQRWADCRNTIGHALAWDETASSGHVSTRD